jgi:thiamine-phosphate pyrophosphorylase
MATAIRRGLYAITDTALLPGERLPGQVEQAIRGGATLIQYRDKQLPAPERRRQATSLAQLCARYGIPLIINDDVELAAAVHAAGVHLGEHDSDLQTARRQLGHDALIGVSCYNHLELAVQAAARGADYVAFGRFFPSGTKPGAVPADPALLKVARQEVRVPVVAIGGITPENGGALIRAGADLLAVIHGVFGQPDAGSAARRFAALFDKYPPNYESESPRLG